MWNRTYEKYKIYHLLSIFIVCQPIIDVLASFVVRYMTFPLPISMILRALFLVAAFLYVMWYVPMEQKKVSILVSTMVLLYSIVFLIVHYQGISSLLTNAEGLFKTVNFPLLLVYFMELSLYDEYRLDHNDYFYAAVIYMIIVIITIITPIDFFREQANTGYFNLTYSVNEIGGVLAILSPVAINYALKQKSLFISIPYIILYAYVMLNIGAKVPYYAFLGSTAVLFVAYIVGHSWKCMLAIGLCMFLSVALYIKPNLTENLNEFALLPHTKEEMTDSSWMNHDQWEYNLTMFHESPVMHHVLGIGYVDRGEEIKATEIDYIDILIYNGYLGILIVLGIIVYAWVTLGHRLLSHQLLKFVFQSRFFAPAIGVVLGLIMAGLTSSVLIAPSVSFYLVLYTAQLPVTIRPNDLIQDY